MARRRMFQVRLSDDARAGIDAYCTRLGVSMTAYFEAFGLLHRRGEPSEDAVVRRARELDADRRSR